eukprot:1156296-Pelagomonas_calceolata.AAC.1
MAVLDVQFKKFPGWSCAASYFFITSGQGVTKGTSGLEVMLSETVCAAYIHTYKDLAKAIPEAKWVISNVGNYPIQNTRHRVMLGIRK